MKVNPRIKTRQLIAVALTAMMAASASSAAVINKADNTTAMNVAGSWVGGVVPGVSDVALWDSTVATVNNTTNTLGAGLRWSGIKIVDPVAKIQINAGSILTNGAGGIDMTTATVDVALSNTISILPGALQEWNVASGRTLSVLAIPTKLGQPANNSGVLRVGTTGTVRLGAAAATTIVDNQNNPWVNYGLYDWAALDSSGNVIAATYTVATTAMTAGVFNDIQGDIAGGAGSAIDIPGIRFNDPTFRTVNIANSGTTRTFTCRGILMTANSGGALIGGTPTTSFIRPNRVTVANTSWNIIQNSLIGDLEISALLANGSSSAPVKVVKSGPGNLIISNPGGGTSGGMEINGGTVTARAGATLGGGAVVINNTGRLVLNASNTTFVAGVTVNSGATNTIKVNSPNAQQIITVLPLAFGAGTTHCEFNFGSGITPSTTTAPLLVSNVIANGTITVDIFNNSLTLGTYPLIKYTNSLTGTGFGAFALGFMPPRISGYLSNDTVNTSISLVVTNVNQPIHWAVGNDKWDINTTVSWQDASSASTTYQQVATPYSTMGDSVLLNDSASGSSPITVTNDVLVSPGSVIVSNNAKAYIIAGTAGVGGIGSLTKTGSSTLTLGSANSFSGGLNLNGGTVSFSALTNLGGGAVTFGGGTLQYNGNTDDISVRTVTIGAGGATIDTAGQTVTYANAIGNSGAGGLTKAGAGTLTINGTNRYTGNTVVANGTLALGSFNTFISNSAAIIVNSGATLDASLFSLTFKGSLVQTLAGVGSVSGGVVSSNGVITPNTNGVAGTLTFNNDLTIAGGFINFDLSTNPSQRDLVVVVGNISIAGGTLQLNALNTLTNGVYKLIQYSGSLSSGPGSSANLTIAGYSPSGKSISLSEATAGEINLVIADSASDNVVWSGAGANWDTIGSLNWFNGANPWAYTNGDFVTFNEVGIANSGVALQALVTPSSIVVSNETTYTFNDGTGVGGGKISGATSIVKKGPGTLIIATPNNNSGPTDIQNGIVQIGNGGTSGDLGSGNVTNNGALSFSQSDNHSVAGVINGNGSLSQQGSGIVTLSANNTYTGPTIIAAGSLQVGTGGAVGSLGSGTITNDGTLIYNRSGSLTVGNIKTGPGNQGALTFSGTAAVTLNGGNTYINNTTISGGSMTLSAADVVPNGINTPGSTGWFAVDGTAKVDINGINLTVNALSGNNGSAVITNSATAAVTNLITVLGTAATAYSGAIAENPTGSKLALTVLGANELRLNGNSAYSGLTLVGAGATLGVGPGYITAVSPVILSNGATFFMHNNGSTSVFPGNTVIIADDSVGILNSSTQPNGFGGTISGSATATNTITGSVSLSSPNVKQYQGLNGRVLIPASQALRFASTSLTVNGGDNTTFEIEGVLNTRNGTASGAGISLGALTGVAGFLQGAGNADGNGIYVIGAKGISTVFSGTVSGTAPRATSIVKTGAGSLTLDGTLSYDGSTTVNAGVLKIASLANPATSLDASPSITVISNAVLDVSDRSDVTLNLGVSIAQTLTGYGTIRGSLNEAANSTVNVGLGTLTITNVATLSGALNMQLNRTNGVVTNSTLAAVSFAIAGPLTVTNVGPALQGGDTFKLFNAGVTGFTATNLPTLVSPLYWTNNLAVNGTIAVVNPVNTDRTNITTSVSGSTLTLTWPTDHIGWRLQVQTNTLGSGLNQGGTWYDVSGSTIVNTVNVPMNSANGAVFYRMVYP